MNFTNRTTYLAARIEWKANYALLSEAIRSKRTNYKTSQQEFSIAEGKVRDKEFYAAWRQVNGNLCDLTSLRKTATKMLKALADAKIKAQSQYELEHSKPVI